ncbi:MAG: type IV pilus twitching motility protein PilT [Candidatus Paceibacterota bacterium]
MAMNYEKELDDLVNIVLKEDGSDIHFSEGRAPVVRVASYLSILDRPKLSAADIRGLADQMLSSDQKERLIKDRSVDFAYSHTEKARFRGNAFFQQGQLGIALRLIPQDIRTLEELGLPPTLKKFAEKKQGFFIVVGPTGHGKSTTLASLIEMINQNRLEHIITIEDPIEYVHTPAKSIIDQRQIGEDARSFSTALKHVFRQDADVIMVGEMRDRETMATAVTAAETGHLVLSTLHTNNASQTIDRIIDSFPSDQQGQIRLQLAGSLAGIFSQRLLPTVSGGLVPAYELLIANSAVANLIREGRTHEINTVIETGGAEGMIDMNRSLAELVNSGEVAIEDAYNFTTDPKALERLL